MKEFRDRILNLLVVCLKGLHMLTSEIKLLYADCLSCSKKKKNKYHSSGFYRETK